ncbi:MAG: c-type cytochrome [Planctomycetota bacterium]|nr:c-type cytochrome [Planctomycetota bacterium]
MKTAEACAIGAVVLLALAGVSLTLIFAAPDHEPSRAPETPFSNEERAVLNLLQADFGSFGAPRAPAGFELAGLPAASEDGNTVLRLGATAFRTQCLQCHGPTGRADTTTAAMLTPRPRDFSLGMVKYTSTVAGARARRGDLERTLREGLPSTAMSSFGRLREPTFGALVDYAMWILIRGELEYSARERARAGVDPQAAYSAARKEVLSAWDAANAPQVRVPEFDADDPEAARRGARLYADPAVGCATCHGADGSGRGPAVWDAERERWLLQDAWSFPAQPRDLRRAQYHGGGSPENLFRRIHAGVKGTPMPAHGDRLSDGEISDLVAHLRAIAER